MYEGEEQREYATKTDSTHHDYSDTVANTLRPILAKSLYHSLTPKKANRRRKVVITPVIDTHIKVAHNLAGNPALVF